MTTALADLARREVVALHAFFEAWLRPATGAALDPHDFEDCFGPGFRLIGPDGSARTRDAVVGFIHGLRGSRGADFRMEVSDFRPVWQAGDAVLLEYVETQYLPGKTTRRQSTALLGRAPSAPRGILWLHLQETWLQNVG
jgi:hypothetical protein